jgi:death on curing protein
MSEKAEPKWFPAKAVELLQAHLLELFGGSAGLRDRGGLESALERPKNLFAYGEPTLFELATAYASGIIRNHPFVDGNKRLGLAIALTFLELNDYQTQLDEAEAVVMTLGLASREVDEAGYTKWLEDNCVARRKDES